MERKEPWTKLTVGQFACLLVVGFEVENMNDSYHDIFHDNYSDMYKINVFVSLKNVTYAKRRRRQSTVSV